MPLEMGISQPREGSQAKHASHSSRLQSDHAVVTNVAFGWAGLIMLLAAALVLWTAPEILPRRK